jgi:hypothetical protein
MTLGSYLLYRMLIRIATGPEKRTLRRLARWADGGDEEAYAQFQGIMNRLFRDYCRPKEESC